MAAMQDAATHLFHEGNRHLAARDFAHAEACFRDAVDQSPALGEAHANLGWLAEAAGRLDEADGHYRRARMLRPSQPTIHLNHGVLLARLKRFDEALAVSWRAIELDAESAPAWSNLGVLLVQLGRHPDAEACCRRALALNPEHAGAHVNLAYLCLRDGRWDEGWAHYGRRGWQCDLTGRAACPRWQGEPLDGRAVLVGLEGGYGDMIQFSRFATVLKQAGARRVTLLCPPPLRALLSTLDGVDELLPWDAPLAPLAPARWDCWTSATSVPRHLGTRLDTLPAARSYLRADPAAVAGWQARMQARMQAQGPSTGLRIGLVWKGNPGFENDDERSLPSIDVLAPLATLPGVQFISLQKGAGEEEATRAPVALHLGGEIESFADTAAIVQALDLVICVDTAIAHLAGALGKPCWVLLPWQMTDWRWLADREDSPWYPGSLRLFRQARRGDWAPVVAMLGEALRGLSSPDHAVPADHHHTDP
jgi:hypothetical protein